jgi:hypothetical protein
MNEKLCGAGDYHFNPSTDFIPGSASKYNTPKLVPIPRNDAGLNVIAAHGLRIYCPIGAFAIIKSVGNALCANEIPGNGRIERVNLYRVHNRPNGIKATTGIKDLVSGFQVP